MVNWLSGSMETKNGSLITENLVNGLVRYEKIPTMNTNMTNDWFALRNLRRRFGLMSGCAVCASLSMFSIIHKLNFKNMEYILFELD